MSPQELEARAEALVARALDAGATEAEVYATHGTSLTAKFLAELRGESWDEFHNAVNENTSRFFGIDAHGGRP